MKITLLFLFMASRLMGATFYSSTAGNDSTGDGSIGNPWRTVKKGVESISAGDVLILQAGTFTESTWPPTWTSGTSGSRKTVRANGYVLVQQNTSTSPQDLIRLTDVSYWTFEGLVLNNSLASTNVAGSNVIKLTSGGGAGANNNAFSNCVITGSVRGHGALINNATNNLFYGCTFTNITTVTLGGDSPPHSVYIQSASNTIDHCLFEPGGTRDLDVHNFDSTANGTMVRYCLFRSGFKPIGFISGSYCTAYNCVITLTSGQGITAGTDSSPSTGHYIANCTIYGSENGVQLYGSTNVIVENILIGANTGQGWAFSAENANVVNATFRNIAVDSSFQHFVEGWFYPFNATLQNIYTNVSIGLVNPPTDMRASSVGYGVDRGRTGIGFSDDYNGVARPVGASWDIGAFETGTANAQIGPGQARGRGRK